MGWSSSLAGGVNNCARNMLGCKNNCSFQGDCVNSQCVCYDGFIGDDCSQPYFDATMKGDFSGPISGGTEVRFQVNGWLNALQNQAFTEADITCNFGELAASSVSYDPRSRSVRCISPPSLAGQVRLLLGINARAWRGTIPFQKLFSFVYRGDPAVFAVVPPYAPTSGNATITVVGVNFARNSLASDQFVCKFGLGQAGIMTPATWRDDNNVVCPSPPVALTSDSYLTVEISIDQGASFTSRGNVQLVLYRLTKVVPSCASATGAPLDLTLTGDRLTGASTARALGNYTCRARTPGGAATTWFVFPGQWVDATQSVRCSFPGSRTAADQLLIEVSLDGGNSYSIDAANYIRLFPAPQLDYTIPNMGSVAGANSVTIRGSNFPSCCPDIPSSSSNPCISASQKVSCKFGSLKMVPGRLGTISECTPASSCVVCDSPKSVYPGNVDVALAFNDGQFSSSTARYMYHLPVQVTRLVPARAYVKTEAAKITVFGTNFANTNDQSCVFAFGTETVTAGAVFVSQTQLLCDAPKREAAAKATVEVWLIKGSSVSKSDPPVSFQYDEAPVATKVRPSFAPWKVVRLLLSRALTSPPTRD